MFCGLCHKSAKELKPIQNEFREMLQETERGSSVIEVICVECEQNLIEKKVNIKIKTEAGNEICHMQSEKLKNYSFADSTATSIQVVDEATNDASEPVNGASSVIKEEYTLSTFLISEISATSSTPNYLNATKGTRRKCNDTISENFNAKKTRSSVTYNAKTCPTDTDSTLNDMDSSMDYNDDSDESTENSIAEARHANTGLQIKSGNMESGLSGNSENSQLDELLQTFNLNAVKPYLTKAQITFESLKYLSKEDIKEAIPPIGLRACFREKLFSWRKAEYGINDETLSETIAKKVISWLQNQSNIAPTTSTKSVRCSMLSKSLKLILEESLKGKSIIHFYKKNGNLADSFRADLINIILEDIFYHNTKLSPKDLPALVKEIVDNFSNEISEYYFIPRGRKANPGGKLWDKYVNQRAKRTRSLVKFNDNSNASDSILETATDSKLDESILLAIKASFSSEFSNWDDIKDKWQRTFLLRQKELKTSESNYEFLSNWSLYTNSRSEELINIDFELLHPNKSNLLFSKWNVFMQKIANYYYLHIKDKKSKEVLTNSTNTKDPIQLEIHASLLHIIFSLYDQSVIEDLFEQQTRYGKTSDNQAFVDKQIAKGVYTLSQRHKGRSFIWNVLSVILKEDDTVVEGWVYCRKCCKLLKYNGNQSSNLNRHKCCRALKDPEHLNTVLSTEDKTNHILSSYTAPLKQPQKTVSLEDKREAIDACTAWAVEDCRPFSVVNGSGFVKLVNFFIKIGATYGEDIDVNDLLPDPTTISRKLQKSAIEKKREFSSEIIEVVKSGGASVTIDMWSDSYVKRNFLGVTLHYQKDSRLFDFVLGMKSMDFEKSTADNIMKKLKSLFAEFGVENIEPIKFITGRDKNIEKALKNNTRLNCSSHLFTNVLDKSFEQTTELTKIIDSCKKIMKYLKKTSLEHKLPTSLNSQDATKWNSIYTMFKFIMDNWSSINEVLTENEDSQRLLKINISALKVVVELCKGFEIVFKKMQLCSSPSLCFVLPSIRKVKSLCVNSNKDIGILSVLKFKIIQNIDEIWVKNLSLWHKAAFFLYPPAAGVQQNDLTDIKNFCTACIHHLENTTTSSSLEPSTSKQLSDAASSSIASKPPMSPTVLESVDNKSSVSSAITSTNPPSPSPKLDIHFFFSDLLMESTQAKPETPAQEVERYSREIVKITEDFNLIEWWKVNAKNYPHLSNFALKIHSIPASSAVAERAFSLAGNIITEKRSRLGPNTVDSLLFLHSYYKSFNKC